jgi:hypothetical protein
MRGDPPTNAPQPVNMLLVCARIALALAVTAPRIGRADRAKDINDPRPTNRSGCVTALMVVIGVPGICSAFFIANRMSNGLSSLGPVVSIGSLRIPLIRYLPRYGDERRSVIEGSPDAERSLLQPLSRPSSSEA